MEIWQEKVEQAPEIEGVIAKSKWGSRTPAAIGIATAL